MPRNHRNGGRGAPDRMGVEPGAHRIHAAEAAVGARARARAVGARAIGAAAEGLRPLPFDRRARHRRRRCVGHADAGRGETEVVDRDPAGDGDRRAPAAACLRIAGNDRRAVGRRRARDRIARGDSGRRGRRRSGRRGGRHGHRAAGAGERDDRHVGRGVRGDRSAGVRSARPRAHVLSRDPGTLARDGGHAGRGPLAALVPRSVRRTRRRGRYDARSVRISLGGGRGRAGRRRGADLDAVPDGRTHASSRPARARRARRPQRQPHRARTSSARFSKASRSACRTRSKSSRRCRCP